MSIYYDKENLNEAIAKLSKCSSLVVAGEVRSLHKQLPCITQGQGFSFMGIDCTEAFKEFNVDHVCDAFSVILQMALVLTFGSATPVVKVGQMTGQLAK
eukprot:2899972-Ditylum_brightwellii.AAC.1